MVEFYFRQIGYELYDQLGITTSGAFLNLEYAEICFDSMEWDGHNQIFYYIVRVIDEAAKTFFILKHSV